MLKRLNFLPITFAIIASNGTYAAKTTPLIEEISYVHTQVESTIPPTPSEAQITSSLLGPDIDNDGIKDDVELYIMSKYPGDINTYLRNSLYLISQGYLGILQDQEIGNRLYYASYIYVPTRCIENELGPQDALKVSSEIKALTLNSKSRFEKYYSKLDELTEIASYSSNFVESYNSTRSKVRYKTNKDGSVTEMPATLCAGNGNRDLL